MTDYTVMSDADLKAIRKQYRDFLKVAPLRHSSRRQNLPYDVRRAEDQIRLITLILQNRSPGRFKRRGALKEFRF